MGCLSLRFGFMSAVLSNKKTCCRPLPIRRVMVIMKNNKVSQIMTSSSTVIRESAKQIMIEFQNVPNIVPKKSLTE